MSFEQRMEILAQSIESHDRQIGELVERTDNLAIRVDKTTSNIDALTVRVDKLVETTQINFDRLTRAMMGLTEHTADHQRRIEKLER